MRQKRADALALPVKPFVLDLEDIHDELFENHIGVYVLGPLDASGRVAPVRVGRSDDRPVRELVCAYVGDPQCAECTHGVVVYVESPQVGYDFECSLYHGHYPKLNPTHPEAPEGADYCCLVCGRGRSS